MSTAKDKGLSDEQIAAQKVVAKRLRNIARRLESGDLLVEATNENRIIKQMNRRQT